MNTNCSIHKRSPRQLEMKNSEEDPLVIHHKKKKEEDQNHE